MARSALGQFALKLSEPCLVGGDGKGGHVKTYGHTLHVKTVDVDVEKLDATAGDGLAFNH